MNTDRLWIIAAIAAMVIIAVGGWFVGISPVVSEAAAADQQVASVTQSNSDSQQKLVLLKQQYANIGPLEASLDSLRESIPEEANASAFFQELNNLSVADGVTINSVAIASATFYQAPAAATSTATTGTTSTATPTPTPTTAPVTTTAQTPAGQFVEIPVEIVVSGSFAAVRNFVGSVQLGSRLYLATAVDVTQAGTGDASGTLTGDIFTLQGTSDASTTTTPSGTSTATPTPTPIPTGTATATPGPTGTPTPGVTPTTAP